MENARWHVAGLSSLSFSYHSNKLHFDNFFITISLLKLMLQCSYIILMNFSGYISPSDREIYHLEERFKNCVVIFHHYEIEVQNESSTSVQKLVMTLLNTVSIKK